MDFKAALLKSQPNAAAAHVFKPNAGDAKANGKDARSADSFNGSGDEGKNNVMKVRWLLPYVLFGLSEDY